MKKAYMLIVQRLDADIRLACGFEAEDDIQFGPRTTPHEVWPNATVVVLPLARVPGGARSVDLNWKVAIRVELPKALADEAGAELLKIDYADRLTQRLAPFLELDTLPQPFPSVPPYAGVGWDPRVETFNPGHDLDSEGGWTFELLFTCKSTVHPGLNPAQPAHELAADDAHPA